MSNASIVFENITAVASQGHVVNRWGARRMEYRVTIRTSLGDSWFMFYDSSANFDKGIHTLDEDGLHQALQCWTSDATSGEYDNWQEFAYEFGYDLDDPQKVREAKGAFTGCRKALDTCKRLGINADEVREALDELEHQELTAKYGW